MEPSQPPLFKLDPQVIVTDIAESKKRSEVRCREPRFHTERTA